jgi:hypothetical protein
MEAPGVYTKVFRKLWDGSMCGQSDVQLVFIYLLSHCDADGMVCQPRAVIAAKTGLGLERVVTAIVVLESEDPASGSSEEGGKRIERPNEARDEWHVVNYEKYRKMQNDEDRRAQVRESTAKWRERKRLESVNNGEHSVNSSERGERKKKKKKKEEAEEDFSGEAGGGVGVTEPIEAEESEQAPAGSGSVEVEESSSGQNGRDDSPAGLPGIAEETPAEWSVGFEEFWEAYPRKVKRAEAEAAYRKLRPRTQETYDALFAGLEHWKRGEWSTRDPDKIEHASTWLNNRRWQDAQIR